MDSKEEDKKRIVISNNISSSVAKLTEIVNIREDSKHIDNKVNTLLFDPKGSVLLKMKKTKQESKINSYLDQTTYLLQHYGSKVEKVKEKKFRIGVDEYKGIKFEKEISIYYQKLAKMDASEIKLDQKEKEDIEKSNHKILVDKD
ncbi:950_t:CDS:2, partial [Gigaspora margarita]